MESPLRHILPFKSYKEIASLCAGCGSPLSSVIAVDKNGFNWSMAEMLQAVWKVCGSPPVTPSLLRPEP